MIIILKRAINYILENGLYALVETSKGKITLNLEFEKTPATVGNFIALCEGEMENSSKDLGVPYYTNMKFHLEQELVILVTNLTTNFILT